MDELDEQRDYAEWLKSELRKLDCVAHVSVIYEDELIKMQSDLAPYWKGELSVNE